MSKMVWKRWCVEIDPEAGEIERNAADDLGNFLVRSLGAQLVQGEGSTRRVTIGTQDAGCVKERLAPNPLEVMDGRRTRRVVSMDNGDIVVVGSDGRAVLDAVFALEDWLLCDSLPTKVDRTWADLFAARFITSYGGDPEQQLGDEEFRTLARLGCTHFTANSAKHAHDHGFLHQLVVPKHLPIPHDRADVEDFQRQTNVRIGHMRAWGIKPWFTMMGEPCLRGCDGKSRLDEVLPEELMGWRDYYGRRARTLCVSHPLVRQYYRSLVQDLILAYPEVDHLGVFCEEGGWFCDPWLCPRCAERLGRPEFPGMYSATKAYADFQNLLQTAAREVSPTFSVGVATLHLEDQIGDDSEGYIKLLEPGASVEHNPHYLDGFLHEFPSARQWEGWSRLARAAEAKGVPLLAWDEYVESESMHMVRTLPTVHATARKLAEYAAHGVGNLSGRSTMALPAPGLFNPAAQVFRLMVTGEELDPEQAVATVIFRVYGVQAAPLMAEALASLRTGLEAFHERDELVFDCYFRFVLNARLGEQLKVPLIPSIVERALRSGSNLGCLLWSRRHISRSDYSVSKLWPELSRRAQAAAPHLARAVELAERASCLDNQVPTISSLEHPDLSGCSAADMVAESLHALRLWTALFTAWTHRLEAVQLVEELNHHYSLMPPHVEDYRMTAERFIKLAEADCATLSELVGLVDATSERRETLKFQSHAMERLVKRDVVGSILNTLALTQEFLRDPWALLRMSVFGWRKNLHLDGAKLKEAKRVEDLLEDWRPSLLGH